MLPCVLACVRACVRISRLIERFDNACPPFISKGQNVVHFRFKTLFPSINILFYTTHKECTSRINFHSQCYYIHLRLFASQVKPHNSQSAVTLRASMCWANGQETKKQHSDKECYKGQDQKDGFWLVVDRLARKMQDSKVIKKNGKAEHLSSTVSFF